MLVRRYNATGRKSFFFVVVVAYENMVKVPSNKGYVCILSELMKFFLTALTALTVEFMFSKMWLID